MRTKQSHPDKLATDEFIAHPRKEQVKVDGMKLSNAVWSLSDAQMLYPELTQNHLDSMSLKQKTQLAGQLFANQVQNKRLQRQHLEQTKPHLFAAYENAKSTLDKQAKDKNDEVAETNFDKPELSLDLLIEKGATAVRGIAHFVSRQRREQDQFVQLDTIVALSSEPTMNSWIDQEVSSYLRDEAQ